MDDQTDTQTEDQAEHIATPLKALRRHCLWCCNGSSNEVKLCSATACPLWPFRHGRGPSAEDKATVADLQSYPIEREQIGPSLTALRAIRRRCLDCSGNSVDEVKACQYGPEHSARCDLHPYRLGKNPNIVFSEERKQAAMKALSKARIAPAPENAPQTGLPEPAPV